MMKQKPNYRSWCDRWGDTSGTLIVVRNLGLQAEDKY